MIGLLKNHGFLIQGILHLSPKEVFELCNDECILVDVRDDYLTNFKSFGVPRVIYIPAGNIKNQYNDLPRHKCLIIADSAGIHSKEVVIFLKEKGYENIANMAGGIIEWERGGLAIKANNNERLTGSCMCQLRRREKK